MRESIGGAWLFGIVIVVIFFFSAFLAYSVSYTRAFNVKNEIINIIEHNDGYSTFTSNGGTSIQTASDDELKETVEGKIYYMIKNIGYNYSVAENIECDYADEHGFRTPREGGYCLVKYCPNGEGDPISNVHYKVTTYIALEIPVVGIIIKLPITGETRSIYSDRNNFPCTPGAI